MSALGTYSKQPVEVLDYDIDYSEWLPEGDGVLSAVLEVSPPGLTLFPAQVLTPMVKVWTSGGTNGITYKVTVTANTQAGRVKQIEFKVKVKDT